MNYLKIWKLKESKLFIHLPIYHLPIIHLHIHQLPTSHLSIYPLICWMVDGWWICLDPNIGNKYLSTFSFPGQKSMSLISSLTHPNLPDWPHWPWQATFVQSFPKCSHYRQPTPCHPHKTSMHLLKWAVKSLMCMCHLYSQIPQCFPDALGGDESQNLVHAASGKVNLASHLTLSILSLSSLCPRHHRL